METPPVHAFATAVAQDAPAIGGRITQHTFSNICSDSVKSVSIASTSASLGVLFRKRPKVRWARCILHGSRGGRSGCRQQLIGRKTSRPQPLEIQTGVFGDALGASCAKASGVSGCAWTKKPAAESRGTVTRKQAPGSGRQEPRVSRPQ